MSRVIALCSVLLVLVACRGEVQPVANVSELDSAGVRIVVYAGAPKPTRAVTLSPQPIYLHGDEPDDYLFQLIWVGALQPAHELDPPHGGISKANRSFCAGVRYFTEL